MAKPTKLNTHRRGSGIRDRSRENATRRKRRERNRRWLYDYLREHPCVDCGEDDPVVLEFDHIEHKNISISDAINQWSLQRVEEEIHHCEVRCSNCHKKATAVDQNWSMARMHYLG